MPPAEPGDEHQPPGGARLRIKPLELLASALAAVAAAAAASVFGEKGTLVGAAIGSAVATLVAAVVSQSAERAREAVRRSAVAKPVAHDPRGPRRVAHLSPTPVTARPIGPPPHRHGVHSRVDRALAIAVSTLAVFVVALAVVTAIELGVGRSVSSLLGGPDSRTTVGGVLRGVPSSTTTTTTTRPPTTSTSSPSPSTVTSAPPTNTPATSASPTTTVATTVTAPPATSSTVVPPAGGSGPGA